MTNPTIYMCVYDNEKNMVGRREVLTNQMISLSSMNPKGYIKFELVHK
jgi:hypothetical protein